VKRLFDVVAALLGLIVLGPLLLVLVVIIRRDSPGPGIFSQDRVGRNGRVFRCHKLRSMTRGAPNVPTHEAAVSHITDLGRVLRRTKLDELPQLWNVLLGEMSLVGPRPCLPSQSELIAEREKRGVLRIRPGITGLSQIEGIDMSEPVRLAERDADYVRSRSFVGDLRILLRTALGGEGRGDRVRF